MTILDSELVQCMSDLVGGFLEHTFNKDRDIGSYTIELLSKPWKIYCSYTSSQGSLTKYKIQARRICIKTTYTKNNRSFLGHMALYCP